MTTIYIWRDALDENMFSFGIRNPSSKKYTAWGNCFIDGVEECFGKHILKELKSMPIGRPLAVLLNATLEPV